MNVIDTLLLDSLGLVVHSVKYLLIPSQEIDTLGFLINSVTMTIRLTKVKAIDLKNVCKSLLKSSKPKAIRLVTRVIGKIGTCFPGVKCGPLYSGDLDKNKTLALKNSKK